MEEVLRSSSMAVQGQQVHAEVETGIVAELLRSGARRDLEQVL
jgi:hypothetical protein